MQSNEVLSKVPAVTLGFWLIKILATTLGETGGDAVTMSWLHADVHPHNGGYLIGSGWKDYQRTGRVSGIQLPDGLRQAEQLPQPIFTPSTKAAVGDHDENVSFDAVVAAVGAELAEQVRAATLTIYKWAAAYAADYAAQRGILLADTKFEFGTDADGRLYVMDEMLTPDSSRYWPAGEYQVGISPPSYDKQFVRDYLETLDWNKKAPGPRIPPHVIAGTADKYAQALWKLAGIRVD